MVVPRALSLLVLLLMVKLEGSLPSLKHIRVRIPQTLRGCVWKVVARNRLRSEEGTIPASLGRRPQIPRSLLNKEEVKECMARRLRRVRRVVECQHMKLFRL